MKFFNSLLLFSILFCSSTTQCMKRSFSQISSSDETIPETLQQKRYDVILHNTYNPSPCMELALHQENHQTALEGCKNLVCLNQYKNVLVNGYSFLGLAAMSISLGNTEVNSNDVWCNFNHSSGKDVSPHEKYQFIYKLRHKFGFQPILKDKKVAFAELWERRFPIIEKLHLFNYAMKHKTPHFSEVVVFPQDVVDYIAQVIIESELLF